MKRNRLIWILLLPMAFCRAQVSMTLQVPPVGVMLKSQLWNMVLVNAAASPVIIRVNLVILDERNNQPVLTAVSAPIDLTKGARQLQARDFGPIQYEYNGSSMATDRDPNGFLPVGTYQVCYLLQNATKTNVTMNENCILLTIDPLSPPLLNLPADDAKLFSPYPQFNWIPPAPMGIFNNLTYDMILVEVQPGQAKSDAIQQNVPVYSAGYTKDLFINYPASYKSLDTGRTYAWRVVALNNSQPVAASDIWSFRIISNKPPLLKKRETPYLALNRGSNVSVANVGEMMQLVYDNPAGDTMLIYKIISLDQPGNPLVQRDTVRVRYGSNYLQIPLPSTKGFREHALYEFSFINGRKETWNVKFNWSRSMPETPIN